MALFSQLHLNILISFEFELISVFSYKAHPSHFVDFPA